MSVVSYFLKVTVSKSICILALSCLCIWRRITDTLKVILAYIQHNFRCSINTIVNHIKLVPLITCSTKTIVYRTALLVRNISLEIEKVGYSDEFYFMAMVTLDMVIYKEIGQLFLRY